MPYAPKPKAKPAKIKVSQATIDRIKKLGMTAALKKAGTSKNAEYIEGIRRMYGERRLSNARSTSTSKVAKSPDQARSRAMASAPAPKKTSSNMGTWKKGDVSIQVPISKPKPKKAASPKPSMGVWKKGDVSIKVKTFK